MNGRVTTDDVQKVIEGELSLHDSAIRRHPAQVDALLDPEYREIGASGRLWDRASIIAALENEAPETNPIAATEMAAAVISDDLILLTYVSSRGDRRARRSSLWRRTAGNWRVVFHQGTLSEL